MNPHREWRMQMLSQSLIQETFVRNESKNWLSRVKGFSFINKDDRIETSFQSMRSVSSFGYLSFNHAFYNAWKIVECIETESDGDSYLSLSSLQPESERKRKFQLSTLLSYNCRTAVTLYQTGFQARSDATYPITEETARERSRRLLLATLWSRGEISINQLLAMMI